MAFNLTANINARLANGGAIASKIRKQLSGINVPVDIRISGNAQKNVGQLTRSLRPLNDELKLVALNAKNGAIAISKLGQSFSNLGSGVAHINKTKKALADSAKTTKAATNQIAEFGRVSGLALRRNSGFLLATTAVYGLGRAIASSFAEAVSFEKELVKIAQVGNRSVASLKPLVSEITRLSTSLGVASSDLVDISLILAQAGLSANETQQALEALAKTTLAATFGDIRDTTEGAIALMAQFEISAKDLSKALGATNAVSAAFAVESEDIIAAVKRAGGVFAQTSKGVSSQLEAFNEFIAVFSAVRATTRESAESIATGLRTIFTRIQRPATIQYLRELGIELTDVNGKFVGPYEAVQRLSAGLQDVDRRGSTFARVAEELGGFRQIGKTLALLSSSTQRIQALQIAQEGQNSVNKDAEQAQQSLANALTKTVENFKALIREVAQTETFDFMVRNVLELTNALIDLARAVKPILPLLAVLGTMKGASFLYQFYPAFKGGTRAKLASGGHVVGGKGGIDDIPAMLTAGEFVINKKAAQKIGRNNLESLNSIGKLGGPVRLNTGGDPLDKKLKRANQKLLRYRNDPNINPDKIREAVNERDAIQQDIRDRTLRNRTQNPRLGKLFSGGDSSPSLQASVGGYSVAGNSGKVLAGELSEAKQQKKINEEKQRRKEANKRFNAEQARLQKQELAAQKKSVELAKTAAAEKSRVVELAKTNTRETVKIAKGQTLPQYTGTGGLAGAQGQQALSPVMMRHRQIMGTPGTRRVNVTANRTIGMGGVMQILNQPVGSTGNYPIGASSPLGWGMSQNVTSTYRNKKPLLRTRLIQARANFAQGVQTHLPTFSRLQNTRPGRFATAAGKKLLVGNRGLGAGLALAGIGSYAGDKIGGKTGGAISGGASGAFAGAMLGTAIAPGVGTAVGAVIGGVMGALQGLADADFDAKIKQSSSNLIETFNNLETGFSTFQKNISRLKPTDKIDKFVGDLNNSAKNLTTDTINSVRVPEGHAPIRREGDTAFLRTHTTLVEQGRAEKEWVPGIGGQQRQKIVAERNKAVEAFNTARSQNEKNIGIANSALEEQLNRGVDFDTAVNNLDPGLQMALALGQANSREAQVSLGEAILSGDKKSLESRSRAQALGGDARVQYEEEKKRNQLLKEGAKELAEINRETELFSAKLQNLSAVLDRVSTAGDGFARKNEALLSRRNGGAGIISRVKTNIFENSGAYTAEDIATEASRVNNFLGDNKNSRMLRNAVIGGKQVKDNLPRILNELQSRISVEGGGEAQTILPELINQNFGFLPQELRKRLESDINQQFFNNDQASPGDIGQALAGGDAAKLAEGFDASGQVMAKFVNIMNKATADFEEVMNTFVQLNEEANSSEDNRLQIMVESANMEKQLLGKRLSLSDRSRGFNTQLQQLAGRAGVEGPFNINSLAARENAINSIDTSQIQGAPDEIARLTTNLTQQQQNAQRALELIATNTDRQVALQEDLNGLLDSRQQARQIFEDYAYGDPEQKRTIERQISLARIQAQGGQILPSQRQDALAGQRALSILTGAVQGQEGVQHLDQQFIRALDNTDAARLFGVAGLNPGVGVGGLLNNQDAFFQNQFQQLQTANAQRAAAAGAITDINRRDANQVLNNGQQQFDAVRVGTQRALADGGLLDKLNDTLKSMPSEIAIGGEIRVDLNINGGEVLGALGPHIDQMIAMKVAQQIHNVIPQEGASARPGGVIQPMRRA